MPTTTFECNECHSTFVTYVDAEQCEQKHATEKLKKTIIADYGSAVWRCLREIEKWVEQSNWQSMAADELVDFRKGKFDEPGDVDGKRKQRMG